MNVEETLRAVLADEAAAMRPRPDGWERIARKRSRPRRGGALLPATAAAAVLALVGGVAVTARQVRAPSLAVQHAADLYLVNGSVWPLQSKAEAAAWRANPGSAPYLADPLATAREFATQVLGETADGPGLTAAGPDERWYAYPPRKVEVVVRRAPGTDGPWVVARVTPDRDAGWPREWHETRERRITSPAEIGIFSVPLGASTVEVAELGADGHFTVLGSATAAAPFPYDPDAERTYAKVTFRQPAEGFGVVVVRAPGLLSGAAARLAYLPVSFRDSWTGPVNDGPAPPVASLYAIRDRQVVEVDAATGNVRREVTPHHELAIHDLHLAPGGETLYYAAGDGACGQRIESVGVAGGAPRVVVAPPGGARSPVVSPDGRRLAYLGRCPTPQGDPAAIVVRDLATGAERTIGRGRLRLSYEQRIGWSPDGMSLLALVDTYEIDGRAEQQIAVVPAGAATIDENGLLFARVGCEISAAAFAEGTGELVAALRCSDHAEMVVFDRRSGTKLRTLFEDPEATRIAAFGTDPTGRHLVYQANTKIGGRRLGYGTEPGPPGRIGWNYVSPVW